MVIVIFLFLVLFDLLLLDDGRLFVSIRTSDTSVVTSVRALDLLAFWDVLGGKNNILRILLMR